MESRSAFLCSRNCHSPAALNLDLGLQGEQHQSADGQRGGPEAVGRGVAGGGLFLVVDEWVDKSNDVSDDLGKVRG